ncbi:hypothetical protein DWUX_2717 [Desulfovibrio diazotrophicus]|nr:hypothetical protein DWUX_2717 [Desulfovibrio diazotrophicus]
MYSCHDFLNNREDIARTFCCCRLRKTRTPRHRYWRIV